VSDRLFKSIYNHGLFRYVAVGGSTFVIDAGTLYLLHSHAGYGISLSTTIAYWLAVVYNFTLLRFWTFGQTEKKDLHRHLTLYLILLGFNYLFAVLFVSTLSHHIYFLLAKTIATALQTLWNYYIYKNYIFKDA
jgi:putative flippase GtrA